MTHITHARQNNHHVKIPPNQKEVPCQHHCFPCSLRLQNAVLNMAPVDGMMKLKRSIAKQLKQTRGGREEGVLLC